MVNYAVSSEDGRSAGAAGPDATGPKTRPILFWASAGALLLAFEIVVLARWIFGSRFVATDPGPDPLPAVQNIYFIVLQIAVPLGALIGLFFWVVRPWWRERRLPTDAMIALSGVMIFFWDMSMNYTSVQLLYNSHFLNRGAWANDSWPTWTSPRGNMLPEPILVAIPGYTALVFSQVIFILWLLRRIKARWPQLGKFATVIAIIGGLFLVDTVIELLLLRTGVYAYPGGIRAITLFAGQTYQLPLSESFLFGGLGLGAIALLSYFRDDRGRTIVERGIDRLNVGTNARQFVKFLAIFGAVHLSFLVLYMVPQQWFATHSDSFPTGYPTYMINDMCASGQTGTNCPGPGVPMPRP